MEHLLADTRKRYYILWTTTLRSMDLIKYIVSFHNAKLWCPVFKCTDLSGQEEEIQIYPSYYFIYATYSQCINIKDYINSRKYKGIQFMEQDDKLAYLKNFEIEQIKYIEENYTMDKHLGINPNIKTGTNVVILQGPFAGIKGEVLQVKGTEVQLNITDKGIKLWCACDNIKIKG